MKTRFAYTPLVALMLICIPMASLAQKTFEGGKKSSKTSVSSSQQVFNKNVMQQHKGNNLPVTVAKDANLSQMLTGSKASERALPDIYRKIRYSSETGLPIFIMTSPAKPEAANPVIPQPASECYQYLNQIKTLLKVSVPEDQFAVSRIIRDDAGKTHIRLNQVYKGIPVYGGDVVVHLNKYGLAESFNGRYFSIPGSLNTQPSVGSAAAVEAASLHLYKGVMPGQQSHILPLVATLEKPEVSLVIYRSKDNPSQSLLAYHVTLIAPDFHRWEYFVDATNCKIVYSYENTCHADGAKTSSATDLNGITRTVNSYLKGSTYYLLDVSKPMYNAAQSTLPDDPHGAILTLDMANTYGDNQAFYYITTNDNNWNNPTAVSAHYNSEVAYEYYLNTHGRNSIDGNGGTIISIINVPDQESGQPMDNAFWNGRFMCYGNGDVAFKPLAGGLDVGGHEMTHGVVENTANLEYDGESGAINESMADIFGYMIENDDWRIGEDVVNTAYFPSGALRSMSDPHNGGSSLNDNGWQPKILDEKYTGNQDNHGVHINSGICNYAFYLIATAIGKDPAAAIYYKALSHYLTKSSQFIDLRIAVIQAATDLYGAGSNEVTQAGAAFNAVGILDGQGTNVDPSLPENPGDEYLLVYNTESGDDNTLYRSDLAQTTVEPLSTTPFRSRPSVTDNGEWAIFVAGDSTLHSVITMPGSDPEESIVQHQHMWGNAVLSKDGNRIGAVSAWADTTIYVYDYNSAQWHYYTLYNPTYTQGVEGSGVLYADALEFDYSGEYIVYDAFNSIDNGEGGAIEYWDVNFIKVWDNENNTFGDGTIYKLFSSIPDGVSIGDPTFSKNSPNILAFDYWDSGSDSYAILGVNIETNDVSTIVENNTIGWPTFNKTDERIAFNSETLDNYEINFVYLNQDKISSDGVIQPMFTGGTWPIYFSIGDRPTGIGNTTADKDGLSIKGYPNPFTESIMLEIPGDLGQNCTVDIMSQTGQIVYSAVFDRVGGSTLSLDLKTLAPGYYILRLKNDNRTASGKIIKME
jgi:bacillolysin